MAKRKLPSGWWVDDRDSDVFQTPKDVEELEGLIRQRQAKGQAEGAESGMAKKRRGRFVEGVELHVKSKGKNLELTFRVPKKAVNEVFPHIGRFIKRTGS